MSKSALLELADRVANASGPDEALNRDIATALGWTLGSGYYVKSPDGTPRGILPNWISSLDAAMTLVPEGMEIDLTDIYGIARATVGLNTEDGGYYGEHLGGDLAIALTAACLRARANQEKT